MRGRPLRGVPCLAPRAWPCARAPACVLAAGLAAAARGGFAFAADLRAFLLGALARGEAHPEHPAAGEHERAPDPHRARLGRGDRPSRAGWAAATGGVLIRRLRGRIRACARRAGSSNRSCAVPYSIRSPRYMNATLSATRWACARLCVTITTARSRRSSPISSSITPVEIGSSALHGSSISSTSGRGAIARAMHSRCCWPPGEAQRRAVEVVADLVVETRPAQRVDHLRLELARVRGACATARAGRTRRCRRSTSGTGWAAGRPSPRASAAWCRRGRGCPRRRAASRPSAMRSRSAR